METIVGPALVGFSLDILHRARAVTVLQSSVVAYSPKALKDLRSAFDELANLTSFASSLTAFFALASGFCKNYQT
jgi:hypothetical protein